MKNILIILLALFLVMLGLSWLINRNKVTSPVLLTITLANENKAEINIFPEEAIQTVTTDQGDTERAIALTHFLKPFINDESWTTLNFISSDNAQLTIGREELDSLYLSMVTKNGESFLRLIIPTDDFHQRWLKYITQIDLK